MSGRMFLYKTFVIFLLSPLIIGDTTTLNSRTQSNVDEDVLTDSTLSFGIKSFTVEITKPTTKPLNVSQPESANETNNDSVANLNLYETSSVQPNTNFLSTTLIHQQLHDDEQQGHTTEPEFSLSTDTNPDFVTTLTTHASLPISVSISTTLISKAINNYENSEMIQSGTQTQVGTEPEQEQESTDERPPEFSSIPSSITSTTNPSNSSEFMTTHEPMINDIHVEKKLENGLYRIKLAEIITDEFNNGIGTNGDDVSPLNSRSHGGGRNIKQQTKIGGYGGIGKINIIDLYPSKLEDFGPIIKDSNEKMIRDKQVFLNDDKNTLSNSLNDFFEADKNIPTSKIELTDGNENSQKGKEKSEKITDLTGKLQEQDGVITEIERKFRLDDLKPASPSSEKQTHQRPLSVNQKIEFIDRRVKKSFDFPQNQYGRFSRIDFANTKFSSEPMKKDEKDAHNRQSDKPEFSTTKFYNSKELYNEMLHRKINSEITLKRLTTAPPFYASLPSGDVQLNSEVKASQDSKKEYSSYLTTKYETNITESNTNSSNAPYKKDKLRTTAHTTQKAVVVKPKITTRLPSLKSKTNSTIAVSQDKIVQMTSSQPTTVVSVRTLETNKMSTNSISNEQEVKLKNPELNKTLKIINAAGTVSTIIPESTSSMMATTTTDSDIVTTAKTTTTTSSTATIMMSSTAVITENVNPTSHSTTRTDSDTSTTPKTGKPFSRPRVLSRLQEKINSLECDIQNLPQDSHLWRGNETHELLLPITTPADCKTNEDCSPMIISWEGQAEIQSGDVLLVEINDALLAPADYNQIQINTTHKTTTTVYQVTRSGHEHCDVTEGGLLDITPLVVDGRKIVTLYDKDLTEGINLLIVVSELWGSQCVRLKVTVKSDNCGENAECSGKGVCFSNASMEGYECQCCQGFAGPHCEEIDACSPSPCTNNGICVDLSQGHEGNAYQCLCPYGYTGKNCQYESDPCNPAECLNGGSCVGNSTHFRCDCAPGYTGPLCQHNLNECESSPCVHGICVDQEDGFRCFCQPGFAGELCNFEYNECESNPCANGGQCIDQIGGYECKCTRGYTGNQCHIKVDFCANGPCPEGHRCIDRGDDFTCECPSGTNGPDCIQVPRTLCNVNPCSNGGTCWTSEDSFYCACRPGYTGKMCEDEFVVETVVSSSEFMVDDTNARGSFNDKGFGVAVSKSPIELHNAYIAAGTLAAAIFIVAVVVTICHCKVNQTYRRFSTRHHQLIPIFGFGRRMKSPKSHRHWLSGKGGGSNSGSGSNGNLIGIKSTKGHLPSSGNGQQCHNHHLGNSNPPGTYHHHQHSHSATDRPFQRHLAMNLENDMYYTVDFSESQHSPLIQ